MGADHAFYNERARVLLPFRSIVRAHLVETAAFLTGRVASAPSPSRLPGACDSPAHRQRRRARRNVRGGCGQHEGKRGPKAVNAQEPADIVWGTPLPPRDLVD